MLSQSAQPQPLHRGLKDADSQFISAKGNRPRNHGSFRSSPHTHRLVLP